MIKLPATTPSGAYVQTGPGEMELYADIPKSDGLVGVMQVDTDAPGQVYLWFMRGGISESRMTVDEARYGATALAELVEVGKQMWPRKMKEAA